MDANIGKHPAKRRRRLPTTTEITNTTDVREDNQNIINGFNIVHESNRPPSGLQPEPTSTSESAAKPSKPVEAHYISSDEEDEPNKEGDQKPNEDDLAALMNDPRHDGQDINQVYVMATPFKEFINNRFLESLTPWRPQLVCKWEWRL